MSDQKAKHPEGAQLNYPDGSIYIYAQSSMDLSDGDFGDPNPNGRLAKFKGGKRIPQGVCLETCPKEHYTFVMVRGPDPMRAMQQRPQVAGQPAANQIPLTEEQLKEIIKPAIG